MTDTDFLELIIGADAAFAPSIDMIKTRLLNVRQSAPTLCALGHGLGLHEAFGEAALEGILMSVRHLFGLQQPLQSLPLQALVPAQEALVDQDHKRRAQEGHNKQHQMGQPRRPRGFHIQMNKRWQHKTAK